MSQNRDDDFEFIEEEKEEFEIISDREIEDADIITRSQHQINDICFIVISYFIISLNYYSYAKLNKLKNIHGNKQKNIIIEKIIRHYMEIMNDVLHEQNILLDNCNNNNSFELIGFDIDGIKLQYIILKKNNVYFIVIRGTKSSIDICEDFRLIQSSLIRYFLNKRANVKLETFERLKMNLDEFVNQAEQERSKIVLCGHSLGAFYASELCNYFNNKYYEIDLTCISYNKPLLTSGNLTYNPNEIVLIMKDDIVSKDYLNTNIAGNKNLIVLHDYPSTMNKNPKEYHKPRNTLFSFLQTYINFGIFDQNKINHLYSAIEKFRLFST